MTRRSLPYSIAIISLAMIGAVFSGVVVADDACNVPLSDWKPVKELDAFASAQGWTVARIKTEDGCYEIRGTDRQGRRFKAKLNPATLAIVRMKTDDDGRPDEGRGKHKDRRSAREDSAQPATPDGTSGNQATDAAPSRGALTPGTKPQVQIR
ncbi:PepSY domain-containing protein [Paraburkholderia graminis]|uniref:PepSY domain-containing protein n=1 Tax=Paraburkholderia graminis TaxID=60548 RepID=UPI0038B87277